MGISGGTALVVLAMVSCAGFGSLGIIAGASIIATKHTHMHKTWAALTTYQGSPAAIFQGLIYAGFTPAGSIFAIMTAMGMLGTYGQFAVAASVAAASAAGGLAWAMK